MELCSGRSALRAVLFDLDGTLVDSREGIETSLQTALAECRVDAVVPPLGGLLGLPLEGLVRILVPSLEPDRRAAVAGAFVRHYDAIGWRKSELYPHVRGVLGNLRGSGLRLFLVTNKRRVPTSAILAHLSLASLFDAVYTLDSRSPAFRSKSEMALRCLQDWSLSAAATLVVGDSREDLVMARESGTWFAAASWGYGDFEVIAGEERDQYFRPGSEPCRGAVILKAVSDLEALVSQVWGVETQP